MWQIIFAHSLQALLLQGKMLKNHAKLYLNFTFMENIIIWWIEKVIWNKNQLFPGHIDLHYLIFSHFTGSNVPGPHYLTQTSAGSPVLLSVLLLTSALLVSLFSLPMLWRQHMWYIHLYILNTCDTCVIICSIDRCNKQSTKEPQLYVVHTLHLIYKCFHFNKTESLYFVF